tara:strand:- start:358 stop:543 length:186 start_codon:yes stop_codon:yes gene_type:complete
MDCLLIRNYFLELIDRIFYWSDSARSRQRENISKEHWDLMDEETPEDNLNKSFNEEKMRTI